jgi:multiple sugar transport system substrate-binding protein
MKLRKVLAATIAMSMVLSVVGCGKPAQTDTTKTPTDQKIEMVWAGWSGEEAATKPIIEGMISSWNEKNPNATVKWVGWPWAETQKQLIIRSQGSEALDVAQVDVGMFAALSDMGVLEDLSTVFDANWLKDNFEDASLKVGQVNGKQLGLPWTLASIGMTYNPTLLKNAGVTTIPKTVDEFEQALKKLKDSNKDIIPYALSTKDATATADFQPWLWTFGGSIFDASGNVVINNEQGVKALTWYKSLIDKGYIKMNMSRFDARQLFAKNQVGFYDDAIMARGIAKTNGVADANLDTTIQPMLRPVLNSGDTPASSMWGHILVVFKNSKNKKTAGEFIKHIVSEDQSLKYFDNSGMLPVMKTAMANEKVQNNAWAKQWLEITKNGKNSELALLKQNAELSNVISEEIQAALLGKKTPQKALDDAATRMKASLK